MSKSTRIWALQKYGAAMNNLDMAASHLAGIMEEYGPRFPDVAKNIELIIDSLQIIHSSIDNLKKEL